MEDWLKQEIVISIDELASAPYFINKIINDEKAEHNKLIHISGYSMCKPCGTIMYDVFDVVFATTHTTLNIYKVTKWWGDEPHINKVWLDTKDLSNYLKLMKGVKFSE